MKNWFLGSIVSYLCVVSIGICAYDVTCSIDPLPVVRSTGEYQPLLVKTVYGIFEVHEPVLIELFECPQMKRLEHVRQYGVLYQANVSYNVDQSYDFNRYTHSVGVWALVRKFGGSLEEQVAALLHDVSHTAFSHVGGYFFTDDDKEMENYQDDEHEAFLYDSGIHEILKKHGMSVDQIHHKDEEFKILEQSVPDICADRFEYNIQGALWEDLITFEQAQEIIDAVRCENGIWYFTDVEQASLFSQLPIAMMVNIFSSPENFLTGRWLGEAMRKAAKLKLFVADDIRFGTDDEIWDCLCNSGDNEIKSFTEKILHCKDYYRLNEKDYDIVFHGKCRAVDPLVKTVDGFKRLSELSEEYNKEFAYAKARMDYGWYVQYI